MGGWWGERVDRRMAYDGRMDELMDRWMGG